MSHWNAKWRLRWWERMCLERTKFKSKSSRYIINIVVLSCNRRFPWTKRHCVCFSACCMFWMLFCGAGMQVCDPINASSHIPYEKNGNCIASEWNVSSTIKQKMHWPNCTFSWFINVFVIIQISKPLDMQPTRNKRRMCLRLFVTRARWTNSKIKVQPTWTPHKD